MNAYSSLGGSRKETPEGKLNRKKRGGGNNKGGLSAESKRTLAAKSVDSSRGPRERCLDLLVLSNSQTAGSKEENEIYTNPLQRHLIAENEGGGKNPFKCDRAKMIILRILSCKLKLRPKIKMHNLTKTRAILAGGSGKDQSTTSSEIVRRL